MLRLLPELRKTVAAQRRNYEPADDRRRNAPLQQIDEQSFQAQLAARPVALTIVSNADSVCCLPREANFAAPRGITGGLAQLGERLHGMQEVRGSSPLSSIGL
jgi:hypothetical protein